jgi:hypothetical protein
MCCPYPVDLTDADFYPKDGLQLSLETTGSYLRVGGAKLDHPYEHWFRQFVGMAVAIIQKNECCFVFITRSLTQAVSGGARKVQPALAHCALPRVACEHVLQKVQSCCAFRVVFHPMRPSLFKQSDNLLGRIVPPDFVLV